MRKQQFGQSFVEYSLIAGAIAVVALVGLTHLGGSSNASFSNLLSPPKERPATPVATPTVTDETVGKAADGTAAGTDYSAGGESFPADLHDFIQTAGANGTTALFANQIGEIGAALLAAGKITEEQANLYYALANEGNRISTIEKLVEDAFTSGAKSVTFEGKEYNPLELSRLVGWPDEPSQYYSMSIQTADDAMARSPDSRSESMARFLDSYQKLAKSGAMSNPDIKKAVSALTAKISDLSEFVESNISDQWYGHTKVSLHDYVVSRTSYWSSSQICGAGGGNTVGVVCQ